MEGPPLDPSSPLKRARRLLPWEEAIQFGLEPDPKIDPKPERECHPRDVDWATNGFAVKRGQRAPNNRAPGLLILSVHKYWYSLWSRHLPQQRNNPLDRSPTKRHPASLSQHRIRRNFRG